MSEQVWCEKKSESVKKTAIGASVEESRELETMTVVLMSSCVFGIWFKFMV